METTECLLMEVVSLTSECAQIESCQPAIEDSLLDNWTPEGSR